MKTLKMNSNDTAILREIAEFEYQNAVEVFETEPYDDLGHQALEIVGASAIVIDRINAVGPIELSDEIIDNFVKQWLDSALDAENPETERYSMIQDVINLLK